jgi:nucleotide-binding universal stress UspA family protein
VFETIVWATDGSEIASEALPTLTELGLTHGATIVAVHVDQRFRGGRFEVGPQLADEEGAVTKITEQVADLCEAGLDARLLVETTDWLTQSFRRYR